MQDIRNIAIIAHVDHGKTTLVDRMIYQSRQAREQEKLGELILDNNDLERERGITILAKNVSVTYKGVKINIIDTPGHSDFGGEVERVLNMADGVLLLVDAFEGCMPQTRFVLQKAIEMGKKPIVVINKVDKPNCRPEEVQEEVFDLMFSLNATEDQLDFRTVYGSAKQGWMSLDWRKPTADITALLDTILEVIPSPEHNPGTPQMLISSLEYSPYVGRIAIGRVTRGELKSGMNISLCKRYDIVEKQKIKDLMVFDGLEKTKVDTVVCGDICAVVGLEGFEIGDTVADFENPEPLPPISVDEPTMSMLFSINDSIVFIITEINFIRFIISRKHTDLNFIIIHFINFQIFSIIMSLLLRKSIRNILPFSHFIFPFLSLKSCFLQFIHHSAPAVIQRPPVLRDLSRLFFPAGIPPDLLKVLHQLPVPFSVAGSLRLFMYI